MQMRVSRKEFLKLLAALYAATVGVASLGGCATREQQEALDINGQIPQRRNGPASHRASSANPATSATSTTDNPTPDVGADTGTAALKRQVDLAVAVGGSPEDNTKAAIRALGGIKQFVRHGDRVVVKPNILCAREPEYAVTTNPQVIGTI